jgi:hypothetical protein
MDWFDRNIKEDTPYYSVWEGKQLLFSWFDNDSNAGRDKLESDLSAFEQVGISQVMTIKLHPTTDKDGFVNNTSPYYASLNFRASPPESIINERISGVSAYDRNGNNNSISAALRELNETNKAILSRLAAQDKEEDQEDDRPEQNAFMGLINNPQVQGLLIAGLGKLLNKDKPAAIAGFVSPEDINYLNMLKGKGVTTEHLKKLAAMDDARLQSLLLML